MKNNSTPKIVAMYRVKNEERWIKKSIESIYNICSEIVVFDDASTDKTLEICSGFDKVIEIHQQSNDSFDESRDRTILLQMAIKRKPTIILSLDGDEIFAPNSENIIQDELDIIYPDKQVFEFEILTLWDKPDQIRYDGVFGNFWHKRMFRLTDKPVNLEISNSPYPEIYIVAAFLHLSVDLISLLKVVQRYFIVQVLIIMYDKENIIGIELWIPIII